MDWKYIKHLESPELINEFERIFNFKFPDDYRTCVMKHNGGRPTIKVFDTIANKERELKSLLSFNRNDRETIWNVNEHSDDNYVAFATDSSGNLICFNKSDSSIIFVNHETRDIEKVADNFISFINSLYSI